MEVRRDGHPFHMYDAILSQPEAFASVLGRNERPWMSSPPGRPRAGGYSSSASGPLITRPGSGITSQGQQGRWRLLKSAT